MSVSRTHFNIYIFKELVGSDPRVLLYLTILDRFFSELFKSFSDSFSHFFPFLDSGVRFMNFSQTLFSQKLPYKI